MSDALDLQLTALERMRRDGLWKRFEQVFGKSPGRLASRELVALALAYRLQEEVLGTLSPDAKRALNRRPASLGRALTGSPKILCRPGTQMIRLWQGESHHVTALESGFEYRGARYQSLSEVARRITRTRWSGPAFFGLRKSLRSQEP